MNIFRFLPALAAACLALASCGGGSGSGDDPLEPETPVTPPAQEVDPPIYEPIVAPNPRIDDGRHVTAYVTWYGSLIPDARIVTHINYAFAELYMVDGVYKKFDLQGSKSRFKSIVDLKKT